MPKLSSNGVQIPSQLVGEGYQMVRARDLFPESPFRNLIETIFPTLNLEEQDLYSRTAPKFLEQSGK